MTKQNRKAVKLPQNTTLDDAARIEIAAEILAVVAVRTASEGLAAVSDMEDLATDTDGS